jgi:hypothetical protein
MEPIDSEISQNIGPVTSVSLYQVSKGLIRHEFAIIALGGGKVPTSWLRAERLTRVNSGRFGSGGLGPPFSGASAFDLVSFSASKSALVGNDVIRVAEVSVAMDPAVLRMGMYISELAENLVLLFGHHPKVRSAALSYILTLNVSHHCLVSTLGFQFPLLCSSYGFELCRASRQDTDLTNSPVY